MSFGIAKDIRSEVRVCTPELLNQALDSVPVAQTCSEIEDTLEKCRRGEIAKEEYETIKDAGSGYGNGFMDSDSWQFYVCKKRRRAKKHGFFARIKGKVLNARRAKKRKKLCKNDNRGVLCNFWNH